jgi:hypothetical protein
MLGVAMMEGAEKLRANLEWVIRRGSFASSCSHDGEASGTVVVIGGETRIAVANRSARGDRVSTRNHMFDDATCVDLLSEPPSIVPKLLNPFRTTPDSHARQHYRYGVLGWLVRHTTRLDRGEGYPNTRRIVCTQMVLQWRGQRVGAEYALQGGYGHGELIYTLHEVRALYLC